MTQETFTINDLLKSNICPLGRTRLMALIKNGVKFQKGALPENENYLLAWKTGDGDKSTWMVDLVELRAWLNRAKKRKI